MFEWRSLAELEAETRVAVVIVDDGGIISCVNQEFVSLFGWATQDAVGSPLTIIIPESMRDLHHSGFSRLLRTEEPRLLNQPIRLPAMTRSGRQFMAEHFIIGEKRDGRWRFGAAIRPMAEPFYRL